MKPTSLAQWLDYIEALHPSEIELGLERVGAVARALDADRFTVPVITVAGTNGKGSTLAYLDTIYRKAGYRTGLFTSPHFVRYNERIQLSGEQVSDQRLCEAFEAIEQQRQLLGVSLSYFEYGTLAALWLFRQLEQQEQLDVVLLEVGLGGRLDAVNIVDASLSVVTTVALDHESWLGSDREQIAREKAGVFRAGCFALYGEASMPASVAAAATQCGAKLLRWGHDFGVADFASAAEPGNWHWYGINAQGQPVNMTGLPAPQLPFDNAATAIAAVKLSGLEVNDKAIRQGIGDARLNGRNQRVCYRQRRLILDVAHNPHAAAHLAGLLSREEEHSGRRPRYAVVAMLADKDIKGTLMPLLPVIDYWYFGTLDVARGQSAEQLNEQLQQAEPDAVSHCFNSVCEALDAAVYAAPPDAEILVMGSFYTLSAIMEERIGPHL